MPLKRWIVTVLLLALSGFSFLQLPVEMQAFALSLQKVDTKTYHLQGGDMPRELPRSVRGRTDVMLACLEAQNTDMLRLFPSTWTAGLNRNCLDFASQTVKEWPGFAPARLVQLQSEAQLSAVPILPEALSLPRRLAPQEGWQAEWRLALAVRLGTPGDFARDPGLAADLALLTRGLPSRDGIVSYYQKYPAWREVILAGVERAPEAAQKRFLHAIRLRTKAARPGSDDDAQ
ncbi:hypothetical protein [Aliiroseovarius sp.]|uniref:hypothetical protein n=1 Tax=Aliiroseovarius sp. TaxID=1872442 RepID=UPI002618B2E4|nr:hypothetical protein [Aliiroseovarius sp.]